VSRPLPLTEEDRTHSTQQGKSRSKLALSRVRRLKPFHDRFKVWMAFFINDNEFTVYDRIRRNIKHSQLRKSNSDDSYICELKLDGIRLILSNVGGQLQCWATWFSLPPKNRSKRKTKKLRKRIVVQVTSQRNKIE
jgi:hypothetical protein